MTSHDNLHLIIAGVPPVELGDFKVSGGELSGKTRPGLRGGEADNKKAGQTWHWRASVS